MFNYAISTLKQNISNEILNEYEETNSYNNHNNEDFDKTKEDEVKALTDFRNKMINEGLLTHAAIRQFVLKEKIANKLKEKPKQTCQEKEPSTCSRFLNIIASKQEPEIKGYGFDVHETFLSRATKQSMLSKKDAMFIRDSFKQRKMLRRGSCDEYMYRRMSARWCKSKGNVGGDDEIDSNDSCLLVDFEQDHVDNDEIKASAVDGDDNEMNENKWQEHGYYDSGKGVNVIKVHKMR